MSTSRQRRQVEACRLAYLMGHQGYRVLGYGSFADYLRHRKIPISWAYMLRDLFGKLVVQLGRPTSSWGDIPFSRLRLALGILTPDNVDQVLQDARSLSRAQFGRMVRATPCRRAHLPGVAALLPGTYRLVPAKLPGNLDHRADRRARGSVYATPDDTWYFDVRE